MWWTAGRHVLQSVGPVLALRAVQKKAPRLPRALDTSEEGFDGGVSEELGSGDDVMVAMPGNVAFQTLTEMGLLSGTGESYRSG
ncbi:hypothetical protein [Nonomuraea roseola]|uniref:Uncharacterized protein n=1 Tax=Nonomuraea roseola TaxID=46179 RepID=A0ABV5PX87_9ACTN